MLVQDPRSGYLHEVPDALSGYDGYGNYYGDYGGYEEYVDPSMAEYPAELGYFGLPFLAPIISAAASALPAIASGAGNLFSNIIGGGRPAPPPPPAPASVQQFAPPPYPPYPPYPPGPFFPRPILPPMMNSMSSGEFVPSPGMRAYIFSVVKDAMAENRTPQGQAMAPAGGGYRRRRR